MHPDFSCRLRPTRVSVIGGEECHKSLLNNAFQVYSELDIFEQSGSNESAIPNLCVQRNEYEKELPSHVFCGVTAEEGERHPCNVQSTDKGTRTDSVQNVCGGSLQSFVNLTKF